jgi:TfoX/Sxy family transcriptional regulator of competence genes
VDGALDQHVNDARVARVDLVREQQREAGVVGDDVAGGDRASRRPGTDRLGGAMAYDEDLANRLRELLAGEDAVTEKKMFGGLAFLVHGHMSVSASGQGGLLARIDPGETDAVLSKEHVSRMEMRGRTMDGWVRVAPEGVRTKRQLEPWVRRSLSYVKALPPKG